MVWTTARENVMKVWTRQLVSLSFLYLKAARWTRRVNFVMNFISIFGAVYTLPANACSLVTGAACVGLQWSAIMLALVSATTNGLGYAYNLSSKNREYETASRVLLKLSRRIGLELDKHRDERADSTLFAEGVIADYDAVAEKSRLPWYVDGEQQLANISLLQSYRLGEESEAVASMPLTDEDRANMQHIAMVMERLGCSVELGHDDDDHNNFSSDDE